MTRESASGPASALRLPGQGRPVGEELRSLAVAAVVEEGMSVSAAARRFGLTRDSVGRWLKRFRERGHVRRERMGAASRRSNRIGSASSASWRRGLGCPCTGCATRSPPRDCRSTRPRCRISSSATAWTANAAGGSGDGGPNGRRPPSVRARWRVRYSGRGMHEGAAFISPSSRVAAPAAYRGTALILSHRR